MGKVAFVFPGQASQYPGMGKELAEKYAVARAIFEEADKALGFPISKMCFEGSEEELKQTANTQPAILACSVAAFRVAAEKGLQPDFVAGHSLGEYSALVAAGGLKFADAVQLVRKRGQYMQDAVPAGVGAMAAILGLSPAVVADAGIRAVSLHSDDAGAGKAGAGSGQNVVFRLAPSAGDQCGCGYRNDRRRSQGRTGTPGFHAGALGRVGAAVDRRRRQHLRGSRAGA